MIQTPVRSVENALCASGKTDVVVDAAGKILSANVMARALNTAAADREKLERIEKELRRYAIGVDPMSWHGELMRCDLCGSNWNNGTKRGDPATPEVHNAGCLLDREFGGEKE